MHPRKPMWALTCALPIVAAFPVAAQTRYVQLINDTHDRIESFSLAQEGGAWVAMPLGDRGLSAGTGETLAIGYREGDGCLYDARIVLRGETFIHRGLDFCRYVSYHPGRYLRVSASPAERRVAQDADRR
ncbi:hypothetical protein M2650_12825 [Luteimonas sp. SX5]|uniref:Uncharacterized protein n=1 Tax=Luteimonas galliterrae TaxID=2940486 RepID=A0ABT0MKU5_9GAMM|nr:hypothetical protein [Luteimonas galliterrae]MCL1635506.1 hypothetical protein [Luteimonas galliterrae]